jgi:RHS repeat-associated protein
MKLSSVVAHIIVTMLLVTGNPALAQQPCALSAPACTGGSGTFNYGGVDDWCLPPCGFNGCEFECTDSTGTPFDCAFEDLLRQANNLPNCQGTWWEGFKDAAEAAWEAACNEDLDDCDGGGEIGGPNPGDPGLPPSPGPGEGGNPGDPGEPGPGPQPGPGPEPGPGPNQTGRGGCNSLMSGDPVDLATGSKSEFSVDLRVMLAGPDFTITRHDTSNPAHTGAGLVGANQTLSPFTYVTAQFESTGNWQRWYLNHHEIAATRRFDSGVDVEFIPGTLFAPWVVFLPEGPAIDTFEPAELDLGGNTYAVWKHVQPGKWTQYFYRPCIVYSGAVGQTPLVWCQGVTPVPDQYIGLLLYETDAYGNSRRYTYKQHGPIGARRARLDKIYFDGLSGADTDVHTYVQFNWDAGSGSHATGLLMSIEVRRRPAGSNDWIAIQRVKYTYLHNSGFGQHILPAAGREHLGTVGDLVLVVFEQLLDGETWHQRAIHYRYHNPTENEDPEAQTPDTDNDGYIEYGGEHQLRMVIEPEQIEHYAREGTWTSVSAAAVQLLSAPDSVAVELASKVISQYYDETGYRDGRVKEQFVLQGCDCAGASDGGVRLTYDYWEYQSGSITETTRITEEYTVSTPYDTVRTVTFDDIKRLGVQNIPYSVNHAVFEGDDIENEDTRRWVTHRVYGAHELEVLRATPSALDSYTPGEPGEGGQPATPPSYQASTTEGLIEQWSYNDEKLLETRTVNGILVEEWVYGSDTDPILKFYPVEHKRYSAGGSGPVEVSAFDYGNYQSGTFEFAWKTTTREAETTSENGPGGSYFLTELYDNKGRVFWTQQSDGSLVHREFDEVIGKVSRETQNAEPVDLTHPYPDAGQNKPDWGRDSNGSRLTGGTYVTEFAYDLIGRIRSSTKPGLDGDITTYVSRDMAFFDEYDPHLPLYTETHLPHIVDAGVFGGPAVRTWLSAAGNVIGTQTSELTSGSSHDIDITDFNLGTELSRSANEYTVHGLITRSTVWHRLPSETETYVTKYRYDDLGRLESMIGANGSVTTYEYDLFGRQKKVYTHIVTGQVNGEDVFSTAELVAEYFYDSDGTTTDGVGNSNRTLVRQHVGDSTTRDTKYFYDRRDRLVKTEHSLPPHEFIAYDNLDRVVGRATFSTLPIGIEPSDIDSNYSSRLSLMQNSYSQRGLLYRAAVAIDPTDQAPEFLETHTWYDESGRAIAMAAPTSPVVKTEYDGLGRAVISYSTNRVYGSGDDYTDLYNSASRTVKVDGDVVYKEVLNTYHDDIGVVDLVTVHRRAHHLADTATGPFSGLASTASITSHVGYHYDEINRLDATINFGTNTSGFFASGGSTPQWPPSSNDYFDFEPGDFPDAITTLVSYELRGLVDTETDPLGIVTKYFYDSLGRRYATVENYDTPYSIGWSSNRWSVTNGLDFAQPDLNRTTSVVYDAGGNVVKQVAHVPNSLSGEQVRITQYDYGVVAGVSGHDSLVTSNDLLYRVRFPKEDSAGVGDSAKYWVTNHYNRLGEPIKTEDQNESVHEFVRDALGRTVRDEATDIDNGLDDEIVAITYDYDDWGRQYLIESLDDDDDVVNAVHFRYSTLGEVTDVYQDYDGEAEFNSGTGVPSGNTVRVEYVYDAAPIGSSPGVPGDNYSRLASLTYPDGATIEYEFDAAGISRTEAIAFSGASANLAEYDYVAEGIVAQARYLQAAQSWVMLDRTVAANGERNDGEYPAWDPFGRVIAHRWVDHTFGPGATSSVPNRTPIVDLFYEYDDAGNILKRHDDRPNSQWKHRHEHFTYDKLHRAVESMRGVHDGSAFTFIAPSSQQWELDMLGNWKKLKHSPIYDGTGWTNENRTHNRVNEIKTRDPDGPGGGTNPPLDLTFDDVGNITAQDTSPSTTVDYVHDAWNRLVRIEQSSAVRGAYTYNGLNWRITRRADVRGTNANDPINPPDGTIDEVRYLTYSGGWQLLQEDVDVGENASIDRRIQYVWGIRGVDDLILRREDGAPPTETTGGGSGTDGTYERQRIYLTDPIGSPVAILDNANASVIERISYDPYGNARHHSPADLDGDGDVDGMDQAILLGAWANGVADTADIDRDGNVNGWDQALLLYYWGSAMPAGWISYAGEDNALGFAGYVHNKEAPGSAGGAYLARNRWYDPLLGRWLSRDPMGYVDGMNSYLYVAANPLVLIDPLGLFLRGWLNDLCDGTWGLFAGSGLSERRDHAAETAERQKAMANQMVIEGKMSPEQATATEEFLDQGIAAIDHDITEVTQARLDAAAAIAAPVTGGGSLGIELVNAGIDVSQGELGEAGWRVAGGLGGEAIGAAFRYGDEIVDAFRGARNADEFANAATPMAKGNMGEDVGQQILEAQGYTVTGRNVTFETPAGVRMRADRVGTTPDGQRFIMESKNGAGARLTPNQAASYPLANQPGWIPRGARASQAGFTPGQDVGPLQFIYFRFGGL